MVLEDLGDRSRGPYDWMNGSSGRIRDFHYQLRDFGTIEFSRIMTTRADDPERVETLFTYLPMDDGIQRAQVAVTTVIPQAAAMLLEGRPLGDLVGYRDTGDPVVDTAVSSLRIEKVSALEVSTVATLAPTPWITYADAPMPYLGWEMDAGYVA